MSINYLIVGIHNDFRATEDNLGMKVLKEYSEGSIVPAVVYVNLQKVRFCESFLSPLNEVDIQMGSVRPCVHPCMHPASFPEQN